MELIELSKADIVETPAEGATFFCLNPDGTVNRVSAANVGGNASGGIKTAIIKDSMYDQTLSGMQSYAMPTPKITYSCTNMTFEEAYETLASGEPMKVHFMIDHEGATNLDGVIVFAGTMIYGVPCIMLVYMLMETTKLFWTADGISTASPVV